MLVKNLQVAVEDKAILRGLIWRFAPAKCTPYGPKRLRKSTLSLRWPGVKTMK